MCEPLFLLPDPHILYRSSFLQVKSAPLPPSLQAALFTAPWAQASGTGSSRSCGSCSYAADTCALRTATSYAGGRRSLECARWTEGPSSSFGASDPGPALPAKESLINKLLPPIRGCLEGGWAWNGLGHHRAGSKQYRVGGGAQAGESKATSALSAVRACAVGETGVDPGRSQHARAQ
jgi:hypothetical protein